MDLEMFRKIQKKAKVKAIKAELERIGDTKPTMGGLGSSLYEAPEAFPEEFKDCP